MIDAKVHKKSYAGNRRKVLLIYYQVVRRFIYNRWMKLTNCLLRVSIIDKTSIDLK